MRINVDRLCELAGVSGSRRSSGLIREGVEPEAQHEGEGMPAELEDALGEGNTDVDNAFDVSGLEEAAAEAEEGDPEANEMAHGDDEVLEVDEKDLVKELRRMRVKMNEARKIKRRRKQNLQEAQLKAIIDQEVKNVLKELNLNSSWIYGKNKPTRSRRGYTHQGSYLKGIGFK